MRTPAPDAKGWGATCEPRDPLGAVRTQPRLRCQALKTCRQPATHVVSWHDQGLAEGTTYRYSGVYCEGHAEAFAKRHSLPWPARLLPPGARPHARF